MAPRKHESARERTSSADILDGGMAPMKRSSTTGMGAATTSQPITSQPTTGRVRVLPQDEIGPLSGEAEWQATNRAMESSFRRPKLKPR